MITQLDKEISSVNNVNNEIDTMAQNMKAIERYVMADTSVEK
jgi:hypothetical protein